MLKKLIRVALAAPDVLALSIPALWKNRERLALFALPAGALLGYALFTGGHTLNAAVVLAANITSFLVIFYRYMPMPFNTDERWHLIRYHGRDSEDYAEMVEKWGLERWDRSRWQWTKPVSWVSAFNLKANTSYPPCPCCGVEAQPG